MKVEETYCSIYTFYETFYLHILAIFHCEIKLFSIRINVGPAWIDYIRSFYITNLDAKGLLKKFHFSK